MELDTLITMLLRPNNYAFATLLLSISYDVAS